MCMEDRTLVQIISGLHTSITTQVAVNYKNVTDYDAKTGQATGYHFEPNVDMFARAIAHKDAQIRNLYFAYLFLIRYCNTHTRTRTRTHTLQWSCLAE